LQYPRWWLFKIILCPTCTMTIAAVQYQNVSELQWAPAEIGLRSIGPRSGREETSLAQIEDRLISTCPMQRQG
jgi:hypothetical protein